MLYIPMGTTGMISSFLLKYSDGYFPSPYSRI